MLDLYQRLFDGHPLRVNEYVISADKKPGVQAPRRIHTSVPAGRYNAAATPFDWRFNPDDLHRLLQRLKP